MVRWLDDIVQDSRFGVRLLRRSPGFATVALITLALGIGANTAIFSIVNAILVQPLPFRDPSRLVAVLDAKPSSGVDWLFVSPNRYEEWLRRNTAFEQMAAAQNCYFRTESGTDAKLLQGGCVSASFFPMLGVRPLLGRLFTAEEDIPGGPTVAVLSYAGWQQQFGGRRDVIGQTIRRTANDAAFTVIGVLPQDFKFATDDFLLWAPLNTDPNYRVRDDHGLLVFARLRDGVTLEQAQGAMNSVAEQLAAELPASRGWAITVKPLQRFYSSVRSIRLALLVLLGAVAFLLAIGCANVSNLLLARGTVRANETVVRLALGATRLRVIRQLIVESMLLGLLGGVAGFLLAQLTFDSLVALAPAIPSFRPRAIGLNYQTFGFAMVISTITSVVFGIVPAFRASRGEPNVRLHEAGRGGRGSRGDRMVRGLLVGGELAVTVVLLAAAGLLFTSLRNLQTDRLGFDTTGLVWAVVASLDETHYRSEADSSVFYRQLFERVRSTAGVEAVTGATDLPLRRFQGPGSPYDVRDRALARPDQQPTADLFVIEPTYFQTLGIAVVQGRGFTESDDERHPPVAVINQALARRLWPGEDPIGREVRPLDAIAGGRWYRIVGVVADTKERGVGTEPQPTIYRSYYQSLARFTYLLVRVHPSPSTMAALKSAVASVSRGLPVNDFRSLDDAIAESVSTQRFSALLMSVFAALALILACVGVYGVTAYSVAERTREVGIRMALGAAPRDIQRLLLGEHLAVAIAGQVVGLLAAFALARYFRALLYGVAPSDPLGLAAPAVLLFVVTVVAAVVPAWRAIRTNPLVALRGE